MPQTTVSCRIDEETDRQIILIAQELGISKSAFIRRILEDQVAEAIEVMRERLGGDELKRFEHALAFTDVVQQ